MTPEMEQLAHDVLHGQATAEQRERLSAWIAANDDNARAYYRMLCDERAIRIGLEREASRSLDTLASSPDDSAAGMVLAELARAEANADAPLVELIDLRTNWWQDHAKQLAAAAGLGLAVLVAIVLTVLLHDPDPERSVSIIDLPAVTQTPQETTVEAVATLSAQHDAAWRLQSGGTLEPGDALFPGRRLTLTRGFAEIMTDRGAIAILQAPATIELIDSPNALRLHAGKLVGICETESSKGFMVRTPHMDVIDLGTRFGVDASQADTTEVHVFDGEVHAARHGAPPILLEADESARASVDDSAIVAIAHEADRFAMIRDASALDLPARAAVVDTDTNGVQWLITTSQSSGDATYLGRRVTCATDTTGFTRGVVGGNAYGFIQHQVQGAGPGQAATATGSWTFSNLPAGRYDVATAFNPGNADAVRYTVNGTEVLVDQSVTPAADAGPSFADGIGGYADRAWDIRFTMIGSSIVVPEGGTITVTIDNSNNEMPQRSSMDSVAITLVPEAGQD